MISTAAKWIDRILNNISEGGPWNQYFTHDPDKVRERYQSARAVYEKISVEALKDKANGGLAEGN